MAKRLKNNKAIIEVFKKTLLEVAEILDKDPSSIRRDEYVRITVDNDINPRLNKQQLNSMGGFKVARNLFFPSSLADKDETLHSQEDMLVKVFVKYLKDFGKIPNFKEFESYSGIKSVDIKKHFKSMVSLFDKVVELNPECTNLVFNENSFTKEYYKNVQNKLKKHKRFVITTAVVDKKVHVEFYESLKNYAQKNDAVILVLPCEDVQSRRSECKWNLDVRLREANVIYKDTYLNNNLYISDIKVSAKQILPLTGLGRFTNNFGSCILASTKQFLEYIPTPNNKLPRAIMTPGACTVNDYSTEFYMCKRTSKIAENDHTLGAIIVELEDSNIFHFRQLQYSNKYGVIDLGISYTPDGKTKKLENTVLVLGDVHVGSEDPGVKVEIKKLMKQIPIKDVVVHDIFDGISVNPHNIEKPLLQAKKYIDKVSSLEVEAVKVKEYLEELSKQVKENIVVVASNHNEFLDRYLIDCKFVKQPENMLLSFHLGIAFLEGKNPLKYLIEDIVGLSKTIKVRWLERDEEYTVYGIDCSMHGDLGANGAKGSIRSLEKCYTQAVIGHSHTPGIFRGMFQVGTSTKLRLDYNRGASSWLQANCLIYEDGTRQLVNFINDPITGHYSWKI